ncbi:MAG: recombinase family protein, partial [Desulfobacteraceae bacterium]|nr:recombinase family protein [Desulfobacteraceae bacterium]
NLKDLQNIVDNLIAQGVAVKLHKENLLFDNNSNAISKLLLHVMGAFAEFERSLIKERQIEGIAAAQKKGKHLGRAPALNDNEKKQIIEMVESRISKTDIAKQFGISRQTLYKVLKTK